MSPRHVAGSRTHPAQTCSCRDTLLDDREVLIVARLANGVPIGRIARELRCTESTTSTFIARARRKVGARTREQLVAIAMRDRLLGFDRDGRVVVAEREKGAA